MNHWILQSNPLKFRIFDYWRDYPDKLDTWSVSRYQNHIELDDITYIWVSNGYENKERGIYSTAKITGILDENRSLFKREVPYWIDINERDRHIGLPRLELCYLLKAPLENPLSVSTLKCNHVLRNLQVIRMPQRGVYRVSEGEAEEIEVLIHSM